ncbi:hypothetical protein [Nocardiopsis potens]|uniref:hypothetical protein n=1 Tax=Nocardiopsis potens TaxID=1246458 RepID=UPI00034D607B|nr:hypothetical protein [Nocardiopsis potens]
MSDGPKWWQVTVEDVEGPPARPLGRWRLVLEEPERSGQGGLYQGAALLGAYADLEEARARMLELARTHTPLICSRPKGRTVLRESDDACLVFIEEGGLLAPFRGGALRFRIAVCEQLD